tara:strand:+ start:52 stop:351 length:300 start_codon:yes stop_codon:yes gene_type:complete
MDESNESSLREMERLMDLEEGTLQNSFTSLDSLSCCKVLSNIIQEISTGIAVSPASLLRGNRGDTIREYVTHIINTLSDLREIFLDDYKSSDYRNKHIH